MLLTKQCHKRAKPIRHCRIPANIPTKAPIETATKPKQHQEPSTAAEQPEYDRRDPTITKKKKKKAYDNFISEKQGTQHIKELYTIANELSSTTGHTKTWRAAKALHSDQSNRGYEKERNQITLLVTTMEEKKRHNFLKI